MLAILFLLFTGTGKWRLRQIGPQCISKYEAKKGTLNKGVCGHPGHLLVRPWNLTQNGHSRSFKVTCFGLSSNTKYKCWTYLLRFRRCSVYKRSGVLWIPNILRITVRSHTSPLVTSYNKQERPAVADKPARRLRNVCTVYVRAVGL